MANPWEDFTPPAEQAAPWKDFQQAPKEEGFLSQAGDVAKGVGTAALDIVGGVPGFLAGIGTGIGTAVAHRDPTGGLELGKEVMSKSMPSSLLGIDVAGNKGYEYTMKPIEWFSNLLGFSAKGYGDIARALGVSEDKVKAVQSTAELALLAGTAGIGGKAKGKKTGHPAEDFAPIKEAPVGGAKGLAAELATPEAPMEAIARPETLYADQRGVITPELPSEAMQLAKERADRAIVGEVPKEGVQAELFAPETNIHRPYTDIRAATEAGGERPLTPEEFAKVHENLAKEPATAHETPPDMGAAYQKYLEQVSGKQTDMFDIGSRQETFGKQAFAEQVARQLEEHPFVKKAEKELAKQEQFVADLREQVASGETHATALATEMKALEKAREKVEAVRTNVETALSKKQKPVPFNVRTRKQGGGLLIGEFGKKKEGEASAKTIERVSRLMENLRRSLDEGRIEFPQYAAESTALINEKLAAERVLERNKAGKAATSLEDVHPGYKEIPIGTKVVASHGLKFSEPTRGTVVGRKGLRLGEKAYVLPLVDFGDGVGRAVLPSDLHSVFSGPAKPKTPFNFKGQGGGVKIDWKDNNKLDALKKNVGFAESLKEVGHAQIKSPEEALSLAKTMPDVQQNIVQRGINALTKGGSYLKAKVNNPIVHFTVDRFLDADNKAKAEISEKLHGEYLGTLRSLSKEDRVQAFEILNAADLNKKTITSEMMARHGLSPELQQFITTHQGMMADVLGKINAARAAVGKKPLEAREAYSAMNMTGDFRKVAYKIVDGEKQVVGVLGANSKTMGKNSLESLEKQMKDKDPTLEFGPLQDMSKSRGSSKGTPHEAFTDALKTIGEDNPAFKEFLDTLAQVAKDDPSNYLGMQRHARQKKGVWGMEGRKPWESTADNATAFFENQTRYMEGAYQWSHLAEAAKDVNAVIRDGEVVTKQPNAIALSEGYMQNALGLNPSRMGRAVNDAFNALFAPLGVGPSIPKAAVGVARQVANTFMLSMNVPFLAIQLLQPIMAMPGMLMYLKGRGMDVAGFTGPSKAMITIHKMRAGKPLDVLESGALKYAKDNHVYATDMVEHTNQTQKGVGYYTSKITQTPAALAETGTRATVYLSLVHTLHEGGLSPAKGLYEQAQRFTDLAMNNYSAIEKPPIYNALGPLGTMAYNLKSFGHNEISRWSLFAREIPRTGNALPLLTQMATTIAFAGALGLPFMTQWESLYDFITKKMGSPRSLTLDIMKVSEQLGSSLGEKGAHAFSNGLGALAGVDISSRVGLGDVLPSHASDAAFAGGGKLGQMAGALGGAIMSPSEETMKAAAINLAPPFAQGPMDLAWYTKNNLAYSKDPSNLKPVARRNDVDTLLKAIGLTGINESAQKQKTYQLGQLDKAYTDIRKSAMNTLTQDIFRNRPMLQKTLDKYFINGQGDPKTFEQEISKKAMFMNLAPNELAILQNAASNSITKAQSLQRRTQ